MGLCKVSVKSVTQQIFIFIMNFVTKTEELKPARVIASNAVKTHLPELFQIQALIANPSPSWSQASKGFAESVHM